jgi:hypothetical protein
MSTRCEDCTFDFDVLDMIVPLPDRQRDGSTPSSLHCPICGTPQKNLLSNRGFFWREAKGVYCVWKHFTDDRLADTAKLTAKLRGQFRKPPIKITVPEIVYTRVPVFRRGSTDVCPALPVRPEGLDALDADVLRAIRAGQKLDGDLKAGHIVKVEGGKEGVKYEYRCTIPCLGLSRDQWPQHIATLEPSIRGLTSDAAPVIDGVFLRTWPNIRNLKWKYHLVGFGASDQSGVEELRGRRWKIRFLRARLEPKDIREAGNAGGVAKPVESEHEFEAGGEVPVGDGGRNVYAAATVVPGAVRADPTTEYAGRPAWIAVECSVSTKGASADAALSAGGLFALEPGTWDPLSETSIYGIDFGTTNTVLARKSASPQTTTVSPFEDVGAASTRWLFGSKAIPDAADFWIGRPWTGQFKDLLPSELVALRDWAVIGHDPSVLEQLQLGVDVGIPLAPSQSEKKERLVTDFKWQRALESNGLGSMKSNAHIVQARFLEYAMLSALADQAHRAEGRLPKSIEIMYSYPPAFTPTDLSVLEMAFGAGSPSGLTQRLKGLLDGATVNCTKGLDEAQSAGLETHTANQMFMVFVDIGGGSLEVLIRDCMGGLKGAGSSGHKDWDPVVASNSIYFGGGVYARSLVRSPGSKGQACVDDAMSYAQLSARIREYPSGLAFIDSSVIRDTRRGTAQYRAEVFRDLIVEHVARSIAGVCLEHGYQGQERGGSGRTLNLSRNRLFIKSGEAEWTLGRDARGRREVQFTLLLLGNGWNSVEIATKGTDQTLQQNFTSAVRARVQHLVRVESAEIARQIRDRTTSLDKVEIVIASEPLPASAKHRKAVVACNLAESDKGASEDGKEAIRQRGTFGFDLRVGNGRRIPWYRSYGQPLQDAQGNAIRAPNDDKAASFRVPAANEAAAGPVAARPDLATPHVSPTGSVGTVLYRLHGTGLFPGPHTADEILAHLRSLGRSAEASEVLVWTDGYSAWKRAGDVSEIAERIRASAPPPPPAPSLPPPPPPPPVARYQVHHPSVPPGPHTLHGVVEAVRGAGRGHELRDVLVWSEGWPGWRKLADVAEVQPLLAPPPAPTPAPTPPVMGMPPVPGAPPSVSMPPPPPEHTQPKYFYSENGTARGPFTAFDLAQQLRSSYGVPAAYERSIWCEGWPAWKPASEVPEIRSFLTLSMPPPPPN